MTNSLAARFGAVMLGIAVLSPGTALASATAPVPQAPKPQCQAAEAQLCPGGMDVKAQPPRGYKIPKKPKGYTQ